MRGWLVASAAVLFTSSAALAQNPHDADLVSYLRAYARPPGEYVVDLFRNSDVVILAEDHAVRQHLAFVADLIPELHAAGVYNLGMEFGAVENQREVDSLVTGTTFDEELARRVMFHYNAVWSWKEYRDLYRAAWRLNRTLRPDQPRFRIVNLSYRYDWRAFDGTRSPETMRRVFRRGTIDKFRAEVVEHEVLDQSQKILLLVGTPHAFTRFSMPEVHFNRDGFCAFDDQWLGNRLYRAHGSRVTSVLFHQPFPRRNGAQQATVQPAGGEVERVMGLLGGRPLGFDLRATPMGALSDSSRYAMCRPHFTLGDFFDGYLYIAPLRSLSAATPDPEFVNASNAEEAIEQFPDPDWSPRPRDLKELRAHIQRMAEAINARYRSVH